MASGNSVADPRPSAVQDQNYCRDITHGGPGNGIQTATGYGLDLGDLSSRLGRHIAGHHRHRAGFLTAQVGPIHCLHCRYPLPKLPERLGPVSSRCMTVHRYVFVAP